MDRCKISECDFPPIYKCACTDPESRFCDKHATDHIEAGGNHSLLTNYTGLMPWKISLSIQCKSCISKFKLAKDRMLQILSNNIKYLAQTTLKFVEENKQKELLYIEANNFLKNNDKIINKMKYSPVEEFILQYLERPNDILA